MIRAPKLTERALSQQIQRLFALAECVVYSSEQGFRKEPGGTRSTPGMADLCVFLPSAPPSDWVWDNEVTVTGVLIQKPRLGFFEVKTPAGVKEHHRLAPLSAPPTAGQMRVFRKVKGQAAFAALCRARAIPYGMGGMDEAWLFLESVGLAKQVGPRALGMSASQCYQLVKGAK